jgi:hypothetical protein
MKKALLTTLAGFSFLAMPQLSAHCQIPCGIYNDNNVIEAMHTDWVTIEKATAKIKELSADPGENAHNLTRWITNKESHAQSLQDTVLNYFLAQRLKLETKESDPEAYEKKLMLCHEVIVTAMKTKQGTDEADVKKLHDLLDEFQEAFGEKVEESAE